MCQNNSNLQLRSVHNCHKSGRGILTEENQKYFNMGKIPLSAI